MIDAHALLKAYTDAEAAANASVGVDGWGGDPALFGAADKAFAAYVKAEGEAQARWYAIPDSAAKDSAYDNAYDTEGTLNLLYWFQIALSTYAMNIDGGDYAADGSSL